MPAIWSTGLNNNLISVFNLIIVFSHPPDSEPARHQPVGSAANASKITGRSRALPVCRAMRLPGITPEGVTYPSPGRHYWPRAALTVAVAGICTVVVPDAGSTVRAY
jgi:hypothetical protein